MLMHHFKLMLESEMECFELERKVGLSATLPVGMTVFIGSPELYAATDDRTIEIESSDFDLENLVVDVRLTDVKALGSELGLIVKELEELGWEVAEHAVGPSKTFRQKLREIVERVIAKRDEEEEFGPSLKLVAAEVG